MTQFLRDQASDSEEVVTPLMLDGTYLSRNFATLGPLRQLSGRRVKKISFGRPHQTLELTAVKKAVFEPGARKEKEKGKRNGWLQALARLQPIWRLIPALKRDRNRPQEAGIREVSTLLELDRRFLFLKIQVPVTPRTGQIGIAGRGAKVERMCDSYF